MNKIAFDPGHYKGANRVGDYCEGDTMLLFGHALKRAYNIFLTRETGDNLTLKQRAVKAKDCDTLISLHTNWPAEATGIIVFYSVQRPEDKAIAEKIGRELSRATGLQFRRAVTRSFKSDPGTDYYGIIRESVEQGIKHMFIVEHGSHLEFAADTEAKIRACVEAYGRLFDMGARYYIVGNCDMPVVRKGSKGDAVKVLQQKLNEAGFNCGVADGIFGAKTNKAARAYQKVCGLVQDGIVGAKTWAALLNVHVVTLDPAVLKASLVSGVAGNLVKIFPNFINANFFSGSKTIGWLASGGRILSERDNHRKWMGLYDKPKGTFVVHKNGSVSVGWRTDKDMDDMRGNIQFCCQGFNLLPLDLKKEGFSASEVGRACNAVTIGYDGSRAVIAVQRGASAAVSARTMQKLGCKSAIRLDSGGSANLFVDRKGIFKTSRTLTNVIYW
ncbi:MAG: peptidoglycan-binding protein [Dehalococcoidia bacterium]|nr:peptidoglycan-binding protein [Dehalococcoidia bacterium]